jgi:hypothetical protein
MRIARWAIAAAALAIASLGLAIPSDIEDSWCAPQTGGAVPGTPGETILAFGTGLLAVVGGTVSVGRRVLRRTG